MIRETWVCGTSPESEIIDRAVCDECGDPIYRTRCTPSLWRHADGFCVCVRLWLDNRRASPVPSATPRKTND